MRLEVALQRELATAGSVNVIRSPAILADPERDAGGDAGERGGAPAALADAGGGGGNDLQQPALRDDGDSEGDRRGAEVGRRNREVERDRRRTRTRGESDPGDAVFVGDHVRRVDVGPLGVEVAELEMDARVRNGPGVLLGQDHVEQALLVRMQREVVAPDQRECIRADVRPRGRTGRPCPAGDNANRQDC
jgi:outer membrane receptor protein involved in Fe transport